MFCIKNCLKLVCFCFLMNVVPFKIFLVFNVGHAMVQLVEALRRSQVRFLMVSSEFFIDIILPAALRPWGQLSH